nr:beta-ketoacyl synthase N-terminal-like domain-containing protein [Streptomyces scabichelini]
MVTGMGFCLPGPNRTVCRTGDDLWRTVSGGEPHLDNDGLFYGRVHLGDEEFARAVPELDGRFRDYYSSVHRYGLVALAEACEDAGLDRHGTQLANAAVLTGRAGMDTALETYMEGVTGDPAGTSPAEARALLMRILLSVTATDVASVQAALLRSGGPTYSLSCGCASTNALLGVAARQIADGEVDLAVVTGVDAYSLDRIAHFEELRIASERTGRTSSYAAPTTRLRYDRPMRPYDERADGFNLGEGAATLILESREHAERRGHRAYGRILGQAIRRGATGSALTPDEDGEALVRAVHSALRAKDSHGRIAPSAVPVVNGGAEGDPLFHSMEFKALSSLYAPGPGPEPEREPELAEGTGPLITNHEACFGHSGAPLGVIGAASTLLMMRHGQVCPTANCEKVAEEAPYTVVTGGVPQPLSFDLALSFNYQMGAAAALLLAAPEPIAAAGGRL